jgi:FixJ family two-component response regulator
MTMTISNWILNRMMSKETKLKINAIKLSSLYEIRDMVQNYDEAMVDFLKQCKTHYGEEFLIDQLEEAYSTDEDREEAEKSIKAIKERLKDL